MSIKYLNWAFDIELPANEGKSVLIALANYADEEGSCFPSQEKLALNTGQSISTIHRHLKHLEDKGYISRKARRNGQQRTSDRYYLHMTEPVTVTGRGSGSSGHGESLNRSSCSSEPVTMTEEPPPNHQEPKDIAPPSNESVQRLVKQTRRTTIKDSLIDATGANPETRSEWGAVEKAAKQIDEAMAGVPDNQVSQEIYRRAGNYKTMFHFARITPTALARHWGECKAKTTGVIQTGPTYQDWTHGDPRMQR